MITRSTLYVSRGGDTIQITETAKLLRDQGITVDIRMSNESIQYDNYTLLHFFNITRPADILYHIRKSGKPFVVSTVFIDYSEYDKQYRKGIPGLLLRYFSADTIEYIKAVGRFLRRNDTLASMQYLYKGQKSSIREIIRKATLLLPNSELEYSSLRQKYHCASRYMVVPNGLDTGLFRFDRRIKKDPQLVLCVARVEGIKNQVNLIKALNNTGYTLLIIGASSPNQKKYYNECRKIASRNIHFIDHLSQAELVPYYQQATVHVLPSWFETTGLSSLESAAMGCNVVITDKGYTREYFGDNAEYCNPSSPASIYAAVKKAAIKPYDEKFLSRIKTLYTWRRAAVCTAEVYNSIINEEVWH